MNASDRRKLSSSSGSFASLVRSITKNSFWQRVGILAAGTIVSHAVLVLSLPLVGLLYTPAQFGEFALYAALLAFLAILSTLRYEMAIPIAKTRREAVALVALGLLGTAALSGTVLFGGFLAVDFFAALVEANTCLTLTLFLAMGCAAEGSIRVFRAWNLRRGDMPALATAKVSQSVGVVVGQLALASLGSIGLMISDIAGRVISTTAHWCFAWRRRQLPVQRDQRASLSDTAVRYRRFPLFSTWAALCIQFVDSCPILFLTAIYSSATAGAFAMAHRAVMGPLLVVSLAMTQAYIAEGSAKIRENPQDLSAFFWQTWRRMIRIGSVTVLLSAGAGSVVVQWMFGEQWQQAAVFMLLLSPAIFGQFVVGPIYQTLDMLEEQKWALVVNACGLLLVAAVFFTAKTLHWSSARAVGTYSLSVLIYNSGLFLCAAKVVQRFQEKQRRAQVLRETIVLPNAAA